MAASLDNYPNYNIAPFGFDVNNSPFDINTPDFISKWTGQATSAENAKDRVFNSYEAAVNRDWQEYMSNTSYQRGVKDMQLAGINPILAADKGGASTPSTSAASSQSSGLNDSGGATFISTLLSIFSKNLGAGLGASAAASSLAGNAKGLSRTLFSANKILNNMSGGKANNISSLSDVPNSLKGAFNSLIDDYRSGSNYSPVHQFLKDRNDKTIGIRFHPDFVKFASKKGYNLKNNTKIFKGESSKNSVGGLYWDDSPV